MTLVPAPGSPGAAPSTQAGAVTKLKIAGTATTARVVFSRNGLAVTQLDSGKWTVTHVVSGTKISPYLRSERAAMQWCRLALRGFQEWERPESELLLILKGCLALIPFPTNFR